MGMYTELFLQVQLKEGVPEPILNTLRFMLGEDVKEEVSPPFESPRWEWMLRSSSHYHYPVAHSFLDYLGYVDRYYLFIRCDFKNYNSEIESFLKWVSPYVEPEGEYHYSGHYRYESNVEPTRIVFPHNA